MSRVLEVNETLDREDDARAREIELLRRRVAALEAELHAERARRAEVERVLNEAPTTVYVRDLVDRQQVFNTWDLSNALGYGSDEIANSDYRQVEALIHPDDQPRVFEHHKRMARIDHNEPVTIEYRVRGKDGGWHWLQARDKAFKRDSDGLVRKIVGVAQDITARTQAEEKLQAKEQFLRAFLDHTPAVMLAKDTEGRLILSNSTFNAFFGAKPGAMLGMTDYEYFPYNKAAEIRAFDKSVLDAGHVKQIEERVPHPEGDRYYLSIKFPVQNARGEAYALGAVALDITSVKRADEERASMQQKLIDAQRATIRELVTPLLPLAKGVVAMPIIGAIDGDRARQIMEALLNGVAAHRASVAIVDLTGLKDVDEDVVGALFQAAQAVKLLGAEVVLTGIQPRFAQSLVHHGADLRGVVTQSTLERGIAYAMRQDPRSRAPRPLAGG